MDLNSIKKRKTEENGANNNATTQNLTLSDAQKLISNLTEDDLRSIVASSLLESQSVLSAVRAIANKDPSQRKLFIRGLGWDTTNESLRSVFSQYGDLDEAVVVCDKATGKSKGYGFITFRNIDGALLALKEPSKHIDGRMTVTQLAAAGNTGNKIENPDVSLRKIFVGNVQADMPAERLLSLFSGFGEIEEGPLGVDKQTGKFKGYAMFVYKTVEAAKAAIAEPMKNVDGCQLICKLAVDGKKKPGAGNMGENKGADSGVGFGFGSRGPMPGNQYGGPPNSYGFGAGSGGGGGMQGPPHHSINSSMQTSLAPGQPSPGSMSGIGAGGYGSRVGGGFGNSGPYGSSSQFSGPGTGGPGGYGMNTGSSLYNSGPGAMGSMGSGGYLEGGPRPYSMGSMGHGGQHMGSPPRHRVPPGGGMYQGMPPYY